MGGWVGDRWVEGGKAVRKRCCRMDWVSGWVGVLQKFIRTASFSSIHSTTHPPTHLLTSIGRPKKVRKAERGMDAWCSTTRRSFASTSPRRLGVGERGSYTGMREYPACFRWVGGWVGGGEEAVRMSYCELGVGWVGKEDAVGGGGGGW